MVGFWYQRRRRHQPYELALGLAHASEPGRLSLAKVFLEVHAGGPRRAFAGEDENADVVAKLELVDDLHHPAVELRTHRVALLGAVELDPGDAARDLERDGVALGAFGHGLPSRSERLKTGCRPYSGDASNVVYPSEGRPSMADLKAARRARAA